MIKFTSTDTDNIYTAAYWGYWGHTAGDETHDSGGNITSWTMNLNDPDEMSDYVPQRVTGKTLGDAARSILDGNVALGTHYREQLVRDLADWREAPEYGVPFDSEMSDILVQVACFGEVVFG